MLIWFFSFWGYILSESLHIFSLLFLSFSMKSFSTVPLNSLLVFWELLGINSSLNLRNLPSLTGKCVLLSLSYHLATGIDIILLLS